MPRCFELVLENRGVAFYDTVEYLAQEARKASQEVVKGRKPRFSVTAPAVRLYGPHESFAGGGGGLEKVLNAQVTGPPPRSPTFVCAPPAFSAAGAGAVAQDASRLGSELVIIMSCC